MDSELPALILIHGAGASAEVWPPQLLNLPGVRAFALDLPGHGTAPKPGRRSIRQYADAVLSQIQECRWDSYVIAGHSMGGAIALELARRNLPGLRGMVLLSAAARLRVGPALFAALGNDFPQAAVLISDLSYATDAPQALRDANAAATLRCGQPTTTGDFMACHGFDMTAVLPSIKLPTIAISGTADRMVSHRQSVATAAALPNAIFHALTDIGHTVMQEAPNQIAALIHRFLHEISP